MTRVENYLPLLDAAIREARELGHVDAADQLQQVRDAAFTASSEMLGEHGIAIRQLQTGFGASMPIALDKKLASCLCEIHKVWPRA